MRYWWKPSTLVALVLSGAHQVFALGPGKVCIFNAPSGAGGLGHVGWGYLVGETATWVFGSTESAYGHWHEAGDFEEMLGTFRSATKYHSAEFYKYYKCASTPNSSVGATDIEVAQLEASKYDVMTNNCLTNAVSIFSTYDSTCANSLGWPDWQGPNFYFDDELDPSPGQTDCVFSSREDL